MGTTAVANNNIEKASQNFQKVINGKTYNQDISTRSYFWYGECLFRMKKYNEAEKTSKIILIRQKQEALMSMNWLITI